MAESITAPSAEWAAKQELADVENRFRYHSPSQRGAERHQVLSQAFIALAVQILAICPHGRERSLVLTKLEEAKFFASAAVARNPETR